MRWRILRNIIPFTNGNTIRLWVVRDLILGNTRLWITFSTMSGTLMMMSGFTSDNALARTLGLGGLVRNVM